jgi:hypothetical protein
MHAMKYNVFFLRMKLCLELLALPVMVSHVIKCKLRRSSPKMTPKTHAKLQSSSNSHTTTLLLCTLALHSTLTSTAALAVLHFSTLPILTAWRPYLDLQQQHA